MQKKRFNKSKPFSGYKSKTQVLAHNEAKKVVKRALDNAIEKKMWDGQQEYTVTSTTARFVGLFTNPAAGTSLGTGTSGQATVGEVITPTSIHIKFAISSPTSSPQPTITRIVVFQQRGVTAPTSADLFQQTVDLVLANFNQIQVTERGSRLKVLADRRFVNDDGANNGNLGLQIGQIFIPGRKLRKVKFDSASPIAIQDGNIYVCFVSDQGVNPTEVKYCSRIEFTDA